MSEHRNMIIASGLSMAVLFGWQYFIGNPMAQRQRQAAEQQQTIAQQAQQQVPAGPATSSSSAPPVPGASPQPSTTPQQQVTRDQALATSPRVAIDTPSLRGSIALKGGRVDDLLLTEYHETVDPKSPNIELLSPSGAPNPFYAEFGWTGAAGGTAVLPGPDNLWTASTKALTPQAPLVLN